MKIVTEIVKAKDVIKYELTDGIDGYFDYQTYQLKSNKNVNFDVTGAGLYGILYKDRLIYVGKFQGTKYDFSAGNIIEARWVKHISSMTFLGHNLSFSKKSLKNIIEFISNYSDDLVGEQSVLFNSILRTDNDLITTDRGCLSTFERFNLGMEIWSNLNINLQDILSNFTFIYTKFFEDIEINKARLICSESETEIVNLLQPRCNVIKDHKEVDGLLIEETKDLFEKTISKKFDTSYVKDKKNILAYNNDDHKSKFLVNLQDTSLKAQEAINNMIYVVELWEDVSIAYTDTSSGDLRIRKHLPNNHFVNAVTIEWQKNKKRFLCKTMLSESDISGDFFKIDRIGASVLKSETFIYPDVLQNNHDAFIQFLKKAIETREVGKGVVSIQSTPSKKRYVVFDLETTGRGREHRIVEVACLEINDGIIGKHFQTYVNPERDIPYFIRKNIINLPNEFFKDKKKFHEIDTDLMDFIKDATLVAHNISFDYPFLSDQLQGIGKKPLENKSICTLRTARKSMRGLVEKFDLDSVCDYFAVDRTKRTYHGALIDVELTAQVFLKMINAGYLQEGE